ncbi:MAG: SurA N-terminal domain-containing protein [Polyangiales bacterium]
MIRHATLLVLLSSWAIPVAQADVIERVVATVNDRAIFLSDIRKRSVPFLPQVAEASNDTERASRLKALYNEVLDFLIEEELLKQIAAEDGTVVTDADVEQAIENIRSGNNMTAEQFMEAVKAQGMSEAKYRADLKKQLLRFKVVNVRVRSRVNITEDEVRRRYEQRARGQGEELRFQVSHIVVALEPEASATETAAVREQATVLRAELTTDNFEERASELGGGELGWIAESDLPDDLGSALLPLNAGEISPPIRGAGGFHIFFVEDREVSSDFPSYEEMREELFREMLDTQMRRQERIFIEELRRDAAINRML